MRNCRNALAVLMTLALISGCGFIPETRWWSEEVQLDDGSVISIKRYVRFRESHAFGGGAYSATETKATLAFTGEQARLPVWNVPLMPLVLYRDAQTNEWVIVAKTSQCEVWDARGQPFPPYWEYRLQDGQWREQTLSASSMGRATNLFIDYRRESVGRHVDIRTKQTLLSDRTLGETYRRIVPDVRRYCMVNAR